MGVALPPWAYALCVALLGVYSTYRGLGVANSPALVRHGLSSLLSATFVAASAWARSAHASRVLGRRGSFPFGASRVALAAVVAQGVLVWFSALSDLVHSHAPPRPFLLATLVLGFLGHALMDGGGDEDWGSIHAADKRRGNTAARKEGTASDLVDAACRGHAGADALRALGGWMSLWIGSAFLAFLARLSLSAWSARLVLTPVGEACAILMDRVPPQSRAPLRQALADAARIEGVRDVSEYRAFCVEPGVLCVTARVQVEQPMGWDARQRVLTHVRSLLTRAGADDVTVELEVTS